MFIVVVGGGSLGFYLTQLLEEENHDVVVIDKDPAVCEHISSELEVQTQQGDATHQKVLEEAAVKEADALVALTGHDEINMVVCLLAKQLGAKQVAARLSRVEYDEKVLKTLGIDIVIHPEAAAAGYIEELITKPEVLDLAFISRGDAEILEVVVKKGSKLAGKKVKEVEHPSGSAVVALLDNDDLTIPGPDTRIEAGSKVLILAKRDVIDNVRKMLT